MIYAETYFDKVVDDALEEMSRKENKTMAFKWDEPSNPFATQDFRNAIKEATDKLGKELGKIGEQMQAESPLFAYDDVQPEYGGRMRLNYLDGRRAWEEVTLTLVAHGYRVSLHTENATETERELDHIEKWIVIEFGEV